jgi:hypothetical protein
VLTKFYGVSATLAPVYRIVFAAGNLADPALGSGHVRPGVACRKLAIG